MKTMCPAGYHHISPHIYIYIYIYIFIYIYIYMYIYIHIYNLKLAVKETVLWYI